MKHFLLGILALGSVGAAPALAVDVIPQPVSLDAQSSGAYTLLSSTKLINKAKLPADQAELLSEVLEKTTGKEFAVADSGEGIVLETGEVKGGREAYTLKSDKSGVSIKANTAAGLLYGVQSLSQLIDGDKVPAVLISDHPRYEWRGLHLDVSRHFFDVDFIKRYLDLMALYKYNVFHWHLTDTDGWRVESKKYPKLTEVGAYRPSVGRAGNQAKGLNEDDGKPYGGFYTREQVKEVIAYAKARNIEVLPEIDVPGHSKAIVLSYPEFGTRPGSDVLNVGNPDTIKFLEEIFSEMAALFPFGYMHIGCDEVGLGEWMRNKDCQAKMKELGTDDPHVLHKWLVEKLQKHLAKEKKEAVAWCEVLDAKVGKDTVVMAWRDNGGWIKAPKLGHKTVVTPSMQTYFNYQEDIASNAPGHGGYRTIMEKVYKFDPIDDNLTDEQKKLVIGGQGSVWTEFIPKPEHVEYITFPRAAALSEALWSPKALKDWEKFQQRVDAHTDYMDKHDIQYRVGAPVPSRKSVEFIDKATVEFLNPNLRGEIRFTTDGSEPTAESIVYPEGGIEVAQPCEVKAIVVYPNGRKSYRTAVSVQKAGEGALGVAMLVDTDMPQHRKNLAKNLVDTDSRTYYHSGGHVKAGQQMTIKLAEPVKVTEIEVISGRENGSDAFNGADLEASYDGKTFVKLGDFTGGVAKGTPDKPIKAVRIKAIRDHKHWVMIREVNFTK